AQARALLDAQPGVAGEVREAGAGGDLTCCGAMTPDGAGARCAREGMPSSHMGRRVKRHRDLLEQVPHAAGAWCR
ncbi:MAG: hypothetical protein ACK56I_19170, partial [bacterium]